MRRFVLGAVSAALILGVAATADAGQQPRKASKDPKSMFQLTTTHFVVLTPGLVRSANLQELLAARPLSASAVPRERRIDLQGGKGARKSLALFVDRTVTGPQRHTRVRVALPGPEVARPTFFASPGFDPWRGPAMEPGPGATARILGSERRFEERQGRFATATTGRAGFALELGGR